MDSIETESKKIPLMHAKLAEQTAAMSPIEVAEFTRRRRQYYSALNNKRHYLQKISELDTSRAITVRLKQKNDGLAFGFLIVLGLIVFYTEWLKSIDKNFIFLFWAIYCITTLLADEIDKHSYEVKVQGFRDQVVYYEHERTCSGAGYVEYEDEYYGPKEGIGSEDRKTISALYVASVDLAILKGMKA